MRKIRVLVSTRKFKGGPSVFRHRIADALNRIEDISVTRDEKSAKFDVELSVIRFLNHHHKPNVLRVDGCYYTKNDLRGNNSLVHAMHHANYVIFQSGFSKAMCRSILKINPKPRRVIRNGIDFNFIDRIKKNKHVIPGSFVASSLWRDNKRPNSLAQGFLESGVDKHLYVIGTGFDKRWNSHPRIHVLGKKTVEESISIMKRCKYLLHLCYIDSCPNVVIEALSCGLNVMCTNLGGAPEIIGKHGFVLDVDRWDFKPKNPERIDKLPPRFVAAGIHELLKVKHKDRDPELDISHVAEKYAEVIRKVAK